MSRETRFSGANGDRENVFPLLSCAREGLATIPVDTQSSICNYEHIHTYCARSPPPPPPPPPSTCHVPPVAGFPWSSLPTTKTASFTIYDTCGKTVVTILAHLWARLLESSAETRSAILLQRSYRSYLKRVGRGDITGRARGIKAKEGDKSAPENSLRRDVSVAATVVEVEAVCRPVGE